MSLVSRMLRPLVKWTPGQLVIQFTDRCSAHCPQCGMRVTERFRRTTLAVDEVKRALDRAAASGIRAVSFTGGEPLLCFEEVIELINYASKAGVKYIRTGTNAFQLWRALGPGFEDEVARIASYSVSGWKTGDPIGPATFSTVDVHPMKNALADSD